MAIQQQAYQSILVANEEFTGLDAALAKAALVEHYSGAELTLLEVIYDALEKQPDKVLPKSEKEQLINAFMTAERHALDEMANRYTEKVASLKTAVSWSESREVGICRYAIQHRMDLIIKPLDPDHFSLDTLWHSSAHRLLAYAACPVLISKVPNWENNKAILACVDVSDSAHRILNESIVRHAASLAELLGVPLHILNVAPLPQLSLGRFSSTFNLAATQDRMYVNREEEMLRLRLSQLGDASDVICHLKTGSLVEEIRSLARLVSADVVVMGTASREGLRRFLIGNSAEAVLHRIDADLLCIKENWLEHTEYGD